MNVDLPLSELKTFKPTRNEPEDFDEFWSNTLSETRQHTLNARFELTNFGFSTIDAYDVSFNGFAGQRIKAWLMVPKNTSTKIPCIVQYLGYGGGRSFPHDWLLWSNFGYAHLVMDTRGQGSTWSKGDTPDIANTDVNPSHPGYMTQGILSPETYYYRRLMTDAVRAVEAAQAFEKVDPEKITVYGGSQGGGLSLAAAGLNQNVSVMLCDVPFLCNYRRAIEMTDNDPYGEIIRYLKIHRDKVDQVFQTLSYFDGMNFSSRAKAKALFSVGLMDTICPPSSIFSAYNHYASEKDIEIYEFNNHEGGGINHTLKQVEFLKNIWG